MRRTRIVGLATLASAALLPAHAGATDGNLYPHGASIWAVSPQFTATVLSGPVWQIQSPALTPAPVGNHFEMNWGCPVGGSEIAAVQWSALRTQAASSLAFQVTGDRRVIWSEGDGAAPQSPQGGRPYDIRLPGGNCNVHLALNQAEGRAQHARGYFIDSPRILVRDIAAPAVALRALPSGWFTAASSVRVEWAVGDNFGSDGVGSQRVIIAGQQRWTGVPGVGNHGVNLSLAGIGDGVREVEVQVDGDGTAGAADGGTIALDSTPPTASNLTASLPGDPGSAVVAWTASDNLSGVARSAAEINGATDGSSSGAWEPLPPTVGVGSKAMTVRGLPVDDGVHAWRVRTTDVAGNSALSPAAGRIVVNTEPPRLDVHAIPAGWVNRADIDLTATDNLQSTLGIGPTEIEVNAAPDGSDSGEWLSRNTTAAPPGRRVVPVDLSGLVSGRHALRVRVRNGGPFASALVTEKRATVRVDLLDPAIARATFATGGTRTVTVAWVADDAHSGVATATLQWRDGGAWRTLASDSARNGDGSMALDVSALPAGERSMRLVIADGAGNTALRAGTATISGASRGTGNRLRASRLSVTIGHTRAVRRGPRTMLVRRVPTGARVRIAGRLLDRGGRAIAGVEVQVRERRGRLIGRGLTRRDGRFVIGARPIAGGVVRIGVAVGGRLLPRRPAVDLRIEVRPTIGFSASSRSVTPGREVLFTGRLRPSPADLRLGSRKGIVLQWLDPARRIWRPVVNARIRRNGTFAIPWTFSLGGLTIPTRVVVPTEVGWPLLPVRSRVIRVRVR